MSKRKQAPKAPPHVFLPFAGGGGVTMTADGTSDYTHHFVLESTVLSDGRIEGRIMLDNEKEGRDVCFWPSEPTLTFDLAMLATLLMANEPDIIEKYQTLGHPKKS